MKGRNPQLIDLRNKSLIKRYYYWYDLQRCRLDDVLYKLQYEEYFVGRETIIDIIRECRAYLQELRNNKVTEKQLKNYQYQASLLQTNYTQPSLFTTNPTPSTVCAS